MSSYDHLYKTYMTLFITLIVLDNTFVVHNQCLRKNYVSADELLLVNAPSNVVAMGLYLSGYLGYSLTFIFVAFPVVISLTMCHNNT